MEINNLPHYPKFVFNCSDGKIFSTADLDILNFIKNTDHNSKVNSFKTGEEITIQWDDSPIPVKYSISKIDIRDIRYNTDEKLFGIYEDDCLTISGKEKFDLMAIFVFLEVVNK